MARGKPIHDAANHRKHGISLARAVIVLNVIEQGCDVASADAEKNPVLPLRQNVAG